MTADTTTLFAYAVESNGGVGKLVSTINTQLYAGYQCGTIGYSEGGTVVGAGEFDHTGTTIYVPLNGGQDDNGNLLCNGLQTYTISKTGMLTFKGATEFNQDNVGITGLPSLPTITGNGKFAFSFQRIVYDNECGPFLNTYAAESGGVLAYHPQFGEGGGPGPQLPPGSAPSAGWILFGAMTDDPTNHVALTMYTTTDEDCEDFPTFGPPQLVSATVNSNGSITTTNTYKNMPTLAGGGYLASIRLDYTGKILAVATGTGVQFFHFDGAKPITAFTGVIGVSGYITQMSWDGHGHLYAQNISGKMHVYSVTTKSAKELPGSPTLIPINTAYSNAISSFAVRSK